MTAPVTHGYPDWGRFTARADKIFLDVVGQVINGPQVVDLGYIGDQDALAVRLSAVVSPIRFYLAFYADEARTKLVSQMPAELLAGDVFRHTIPVAGAFGEVVYNGGAFPATLDLRVGTASARDARGIALGAEQHLITGIGIAVGAGAVNNQNAQHVWPGDGFWAVQASPATWSCYLVSVDIGGVQRMIDAMTQASVERARRILLPSMHLRTVFTNTAGVAGAYDISVMAQSPIGR